MSISEHSDVPKGSSAGLAQRLEISTGVGRRRSWTAEQKAAIVAESFEDGALVGHVARRHGLTPQQLSARVEHLGSAEMTGGIIMDSKGRLYGGDLEHSSVVMLTYDGKTKKLASHVFVNQPGRLAWADGFAISQGWLYISDSHLNETNYQNSLPRSGNWSIFRVKLPR